MRTKKIALFYQVTQDEVFSPAIREIERKELWIKEVQKTVEAPHKPKIIKATFEVFDSEVMRQSRFFNGTCVLYYAIQNMDGDVPDNKVLKMYREQLLDEALGFNLQLSDRTIRKRKSTSDYKSVQAWNTFLKTVQETIFDDAGYEFPDSKVFWEDVENYGQEQAKKIAIERLQKNISKK